MTNSDQCSATLNNSLEIPDINEYSTTVINIFQDSSFFANMELDMKKEDEHLKTFLSELGEIINDI